jgi:hypothetical protein
MSRRLVEEYRLSEKVGVKLGPNPGALKSEEICSFETSVSTSKIKQGQNPKYPLTWEPENLYFNLLIILVYFLVIPKIGHTSTALLNFMLC